VGIQVAASRWWTAGTAPQCHRVRGGRGAAWSPQGEERLLAPHLGGVRQQVLGERHERSALGAVVRRRRRRGDGAHAYPRRPLRVVSIFLDKNICK
jgi:hypothetical protein